MTILSAARPVRSRILLLPLIIASGVGCQPAAPPVPQVTPTATPTPVTTLADVYVRVAAGRLKEGRVPEALAELDAALAASPEHVPALVLRGRALSLLARHEEAVTSLQTAIELGDRSAETRHLLASALVQARRFSEAEPIYRALLADDADDAIAAKGLAMLLYDQDRLDETIAAFERALELDPDDADVARVLGRELRRRGLLERALAALEQARELAPKDAETNYQLGLARRDSGDAEGANASFRAALEADPYHTGALTQLTKTAKLAGDAAAETELTARFEEAQRLQAERDRLRNDILHAPDNVEALAALAALEARTAHWEMAASLFGRLLVLQPRNAAFASALGRTLVQLDRLDEALPHFERAASLAPDSPDSQLDLAQARIELGQPEAARAPLQQARAAAAAGAELTDRQRARLDRLSGLVGMAAHR